MRGGKEECGCDVEAILWAAAVGSGGDVLFGGVLRLVYFVGMGVFEDEVLKPCRVWRVLVGARSFASGLD